MNRPGDITFHNLGDSEAMEAHAHERVDELVRWFPGITWCEVSVEADPGAGGTNGPYRCRVRVEVHATGGGDRDPVGMHEHENVYAAMDGAFNAVTRRLEAWARTQPGGGVQFRGQ